MPSWNGAEAAAGDVFPCEGNEKPGFLAHFVQQQNEGSGRISEAIKKRRLGQEGVSESEPTIAHD